MKLNRIEQNTKYNAINKKAIIISIYFNRLGTL